MPEVILFVKDLDYEVDRSVARLVQAASGSGSYACVILDDCKDGQMATSHGKEESRGLDLAVPTLHSGEESNAQRPGAAPMALHTVTPSSSAQDYGHSLGTVREFVPF